VGSLKGEIQAIQVWNEPNLSREWGDAPISRDQAAQYMYMLKETYTLVKQVDPTKIIVSAGLSPTGTNDGTAQPDDVYLNWLYDNDLDRYADAIRDATLALVREGGFREYFDPETGEGLGSDQFSWSAALVLDFVREPAPANSRISSASRSGWSSGTNE